MGVANKTETDAGRLMLRLRKAATVDDNPRLLELLASDLTFLDALVRGLEWTAENVEGFGHPTISLEEDPEEYTEYIKVEFPVSLEPEAYVQSLLYLTDVWAIDVYTKAPVEFCVSPEFV